MEAKQAVDKGSDFIHKQRDRLNQRQEELLNEHRNISNELRQRQEPLDRNMEDQATQLEHEEVLKERFHQIEQELDLVVAAQERMLAAAYGICVSCGDPIPRERLEALPYAQLCLTCAEEAELDAKRKVPR